MHLSKIIAISATILAGVAAIPMQEDSNAIEARQPKNGGNKNTSSATDTATATAKSKTSSVAESATTSAATATGTATATVTGDVDPNFDLAAATSAEQAAAVSRILRL